MLSKDLLNDAFWAWVEEVFARSQGALKTCC